VPSSRSPGQVDLRVKTTWLTVFRIVASTVLLGVLAARLFKTRPVEGLAAADLASFGLVGGVYALTLLLGLLLRFGRIGRGVAWAQIVADVVLASCLVFLSGGPDSPFTFVYSLAVIAASVLLYRAGALVAAALSAVGYVAVVALLQTGFAVSASGWMVRPLSDLVVWGSLPVLAQFLVAILSGTVAEQLFLTGGRLSAREHDLRELTVLQERIVSAMPSGLVTCDSQGVVTFMNPASEALLDRARPLPERLHVEDLFPGALQGGIEGRRAELQVPTASGTKTLGLTVTPLEEGRAGSLIVFQDLTEFRRLESELKRIDHLASLGRISAQLAHEVRNPLASIRGAAQMLGSDQPPGGSDARMSRLIVREVDRLSSLVDDYLKLARPPPPVLRREAVDGVVAETLAIFRSDPMSQGIPIEMALEAVQADVDAGQVRQVLINFLRNGVAAIGRRGTMRVALEALGEVFALEVWDSAGNVGDPTRIFEPFYSTREGGTGLGLSTAQSIVHAHGGRIEVKSNATDGTTFRAVFPVRARGE
jgi:two-component system sensor histidine kinase PilS (NtrC family)